MLYIFLAENCPWCWFYSFTITGYGKFGEWAWVGRDYNEEGRVYGDGETILYRWSALGGRE